MASSSCGIWRSGVKSRGPNGIVSAPQHPPTPCKFVLSCDTFCSAGRSSSREDVDSRTCSWPLLPILANSIYSIPASPAPELEQAPLEIKGPVLGERGNVAWGGFRQDKSREGE